MRLFPERLKDPRTWRDTLAVAGLVVTTLGVAVVYAVEPQSPRDLLDRVALALNEHAYGPNLRTGERLLAAGRRAEAAGADSLADDLQWRAAGAFERAAAAAPGPRQAMLANDRAADAYLAMGRRHVERGRGIGFGVGRDAGHLGAAERIAACMVSLAPTRRRGQINAFIEGLEDILDRPLAGSCLR